jgi:hypothetical protein
MAGDKIACSVEKLGELRFGLVYRNLADRCIIQRAPILRNNRYYTALLFDNITLVVEYAHAGHSPAKWFMAGLLPKNTHKRNARAGEDNRLLGDVTFRFTWLNFAAAYHSIQIASMVRSTRCVSRRQ